MPAILALDIGTSSVRASIFDGRLDVSRSAAVPYDWRVYQDGRIEIDPHRLERVVGEAIDRVLVGRGRGIDAVAVATFWHSIMGIDRSNRPLTPLIPWSDVRGDDEAIRLRRELSERRVHARTGCRLHASYWPARIRWFARHEPATYARVARWITFGEWIEARWLGRTGVSNSQAAGTGLMIQDASAWDPDLLRACHIDTDTLAPIIDVTDADGTLNRRLRARWPALAGARWFPAVGDGALNNVGAGCTTRGRAALMIGTSAALRVLWEPRPHERVRQPFTLWRYRLDRRRLVIGGALSNGGNVREWLLRLVAGTRGLDARAAALPPDAHGLTILPFLAGTRSPDYLTHATGTITGIRLATGPEQLLRGVMEAVAFRFALVFEELTSVNPVQEIVAAGGALERSAAWTQILADALGKAITLCRARELTSRGAAALALELLGGPGVSRLAPPRGRIVRPDPGRHRIYTAAGARQRALMRQVIPKQR